MSSSSRHPRRLESGPRLPFWSHSPENRRRQGSGGSSSSSTTQNDSHSNPNSYRDSRNHEKGKEKGKRDPVEVGWTSYKQKGHRIMSKSSGFSAHAAEAAHMVSMRSGAQLRNSSFDADVVHTSGRTRKRPITTKNPEAARSSRRADPTEAEELNGPYSSDEGEVSRRERKARRGSSPGSTKSLPVNVGPGKGNMSLFSLDVEAESYSGGYPPNVTSPSTPQHQHMQHGYPQSTQTHSTSSHTPAPNHGHNLVMNVNNSGAADVDNDSNANSNAVQRQNQINQVRNTSSAGQKQFSLFGGAQYVNPPAQSSTGGRGREDGKGTSNKPFSVIQPIPRWLSMDVLPRPLPGNLPASTTDGGVGDRERDGGKYISLVDVFGGGNTQWLDPHSDKNANVKDVDVDEAPMDSVSVTVGIKESGIDVEEEDQKPSFVRIQNGDDVGAGGINITTPIASISSPTAFPTPIRLVDGFEKEEESPSVNANANANVDTQQDDLGIEQLSLQSLVPDRQHAQMQPKRGEDGKKVIGGGRQWDKEDIDVFNFLQTADNVVIQDSQLRKEKEKGREVRWETSIDDDDDDVVIGSDNELEFDSQGPRTSAEIPIRNLSLNASVNADMSAQGVVVEWILMNSVPCDWSVKDSIRFVSSNAFEWFRAPSFRALAYGQMEHTLSAPMAVPSLPACQARQANLDLTANKPVSDYVCGRSCLWHSVNRLRLNERLVCEMEKAILHWKYPATPLSPASQRALEGLSKPEYQHTAAERAEADYMRERLRNWIDAFHSLFNLLKYKKIPCFYIMGDGYSMLFREIIDGGVGGKVRRWARSINNNNASDRNANDPIEFCGVDECTRLFDCISSYVSKSHVDVPTLHATRPFMYSSEDRLKLKFDKVSRERSRHNRHLRKEVPVVSSPATSPPASHLVKSMSSPDFMDTASPEDDGLEVLHTLQIIGTILPITTLRLMHIMSSAQGGNFDSLLTTDDRTLPFNLQPSDMSVQSQSGSEIQLYKFNGTEIDALRGGAQGQSVDVDSTTPSQPSLQQTQSQGQSQSQIEDTVFSPRASLPNLVHSQSQTQIGQGHGSGRMISKSRGRSYQAGAPVCKCPNPHISSQLQSASPLDDVLHRVVAVDGLFGVNVKRLL